MEKHQRERPKFLHGNSSHTLMWTCSGEVPPSVVNVVEKDQRVPREEEARSLGSFFFVLFLFLLLFLSEDELGGLHHSATRTAQTFRLLLLLLLHLPESRLLEEGYSGVVDAVNRPVTASRREEVPLRSATRCGRSAPAQPPQTEVPAASPSEVCSVSTELRASRSPHPHSLPRPQAPRAVHCGGGPSPAP